eukprot:1362873-Amorphochlora_amoeboformis.AAC.1
MLAKNNIDTQTLSLNPNLFFDCHRVIVLECLHLRLIALFNEKFRGLVLGAGLLLAGPGLFHSLSQARDLILFDVETASKAGKLGV